MCIRDSVAAVLVEVAVGGVLAEEVPGLGGAGDAGGVLADDGALACLLYTSRCV
ncbi:hypothetical protein [Streptomyces fragilis]|uniref:hypothetical protein n=1 Tax=Streptomyces fragilis TaxID=67301 RepID=UPI0027E33311|nr:hypothetical protein [Streptomyces fragilis]